MPDHTTPDPAGTDPLSTTLHGLAGDSALLTGVLVEPAELRRRGDRRHRRRTVVSAAGALVLVLGGAGAAVAVLSPDRDRPATTAPIAASSTPTPSDSASPSSSPSHTPSPSQQLGSQALLRPADLTGIGVLGRRWTTSTSDFYGSVGCALAHSPSVPTGTPLVTLEELGSDGRPPEAEGPIISESLLPDAAAACTGPGWTTVRSSGDLLVQRFNGDGTQGTAPWATYRMVVVAGGARAVVSADFGETVQQDVVAVKIGAVALTRLRAAVDGITTATPAALRPVQDLLIGRPRGSPAA